VIVGVNVRVAVGVWVTVGESAGSVNVAKGVPVRSLVAVSVGVAVPFPAETPHKSSRPNR